MKINEDAKASDLAGTAHASGSFTGTPENQRRVAKRCLSFSMAGILASVPAHSFDLARTGGL